MTNRIKTDRVEIKAFHSIPSHPIPFHSKWAFGQIVRNPVRMLHMCGHYKFLLCSPSFFSQILIN